MATDRISITDEEFFSILKFQKLVVNGSSSGKMNNFRLLFFYPTEDLASDYYG